MSAIFQNKSGSEPGKNSTSQNISVEKIKKEWIYCINFPLLCIPERVFDMVIEMLFSIYGYVFDVDSKGF
jgi:hypothetical protein